MKKTVAKKTLLLFIGIFILLIPIKSNAEPARGSRENPLYAYESYTTDVYDYSDYMGKFQIQLLDYKDGKDAYDYVMQNEYNAKPTSSQEYIYIKFKISYISGSEQIKVSDVINYHSDLFNTDANYQLSNINWGFSFEDVEDMINVSLYPGGSAICSTAIIVKSGNTPITYRIQTGYNSSEYEPIYTWFTTQIPEGRCPRGCTYKETISKNPTCTESGERKYGCVNCWYFYTEEIPSIGHNYIEESTKQVNCEQDGIIICTCSNCGDSYKVTIPHFGHNYVGKITKRPGCTSAGIKTYTCSNCKKTYTDTIPATNHKYSSWKTSKKPTIFKNGTKTRKCSNCGKQETKTIKKLKASVSIKKKASVKAGKSIQLKIYKKSKGDKISNWTSSKKSVATVNKKGKVTARKKGKAKITVKMKSGCKATCTVTVK